jgi:CRP-like cAMP-binding protein
MSETIKLNPDELLLYEGQETNEMYYLQSGSLSVLKRKGDQQIQIETISPGELVGEMSFLDDHPRCATVKAITYSVLVRISNEKYSRMKDAHPKWLKVLISTLLSRIRKTNNLAKV